MILRLGERRPVFEGEGQYVADNAMLVGSVRLKANASVWFGAVLRGDNDDIVIGCDSNVQDGAVLHTDPGMPLTVGDRVTVGHLAMLHGCTVGDDSLVGIGATIMNEARIGRRSVVGAHALVTEGKSFPDGVLIVGAPARIARELEPGELEALSQAAAVYVDKGRRYTDGLEVCEPLRE